MRSEVALAGCGRTTPEELIWIIAIAVARGLDPDSLRDVA